MRIALALVALAAAAAQAVADGPAPISGSRVTLRWVDVYGDVGTREFDAMSEDVIGLFREIGLDVAWTRSDPGEGFEPKGPTEIPVIALRSPPAHLGRDHILGLVVRERVSPSPIWIFTDDIRWALGHDKDTPTDGERGEIARAVGRVIAHEVSHSLAPRHAHAISGLMSPRLGRGRLLAPRATLDPEWVRSVRSGFAALAARGDADLGVGSAVAKGFPAVR